MNAQQLIDSSRPQRTVFLTGATGLVGRYLMVDFLRRGVSLAVLVRPGAMADARQRVETILQPFESVTLLPRPRVIAGSLHDDGLGLSECDQQWLSDCKLSVVHCAASIKFVAEEGRAGEPYATNVDGTRRLLSLCEQFDVEAFHHVSTAYVGVGVATVGLNAAERAVTKVEEQLVRDTELAGNDYEMSKILAETLVADSPLRARKTIHRPSIVVGDSQTGFTSTYHGFYAPLQIGAQIARKIGFSKGQGRWFREQLGLSEEDCKNLVPVDWLSEVIVRTVVQDWKRCSQADNGSSLKQSLAAERELGDGNRVPRVLHWTNPKPVSSVTMQDAITDSIEEAFASEKQSVGTQLESLGGAFREQMSVYESYFSGDPDFDVSHSAAEQPSLPCPTVDYEMLRRLSQSAIDANFGWPKPAIAEVPDQDLVSVLRSYEVAGDGGTAPQVVLVLLGAGAIETLRFEKIQNNWYQAGIERNAPIVLTVALAALKGAISGKTGIDDLFSQGRATIHGAIPAQWLAIIADWKEDVRLRMAL